MASSNVKDSTDHEEETTKKDPFNYLTGFGNEFESEYLPGALPVGRNNPKSVPYGLYTEQLSGTAFTAPRAHNRRTWLYRLQPSVVLQDACKDATEPKQFFGGTNPADCTPPTNPMRWKPNHDNDNDNPATRDFVDGVQLLCTTPGGTPMTKSGLSIYLYSANASMQSKRALCNADGDFLVVPTEGILTIHTEMGRLQVQPHEMCVLPRGIVFAIHVAEREQQETSTFSRGYLLEVYQAGDGFRLPDLGLIGANGLANPRDFESPTAWCPAKPDLEQPCTIFFKMNGLLHKRVQDHSPFNVVAWHGNYVPYKYDLGRFCPMNAVSYDHADPSIFTVLTCPSGAAAGTALVDVVVFPPRVQATDPNTLRPPWFHRNCMSEFMGLITGTYDAKQDFCAGGASLHNCMTPHGPDAATYQAAVAHPCDTPTRLDGGYAFMFETYLPLAVAPSGYDASGPLWKRDVDYTECWTKQQGGLSVTFTGWDLLEKQKQQEREDEGKA